MRLLRLDDLITSYTNARPDAGRHARQVKPSRGIPRQNQTRYGRDMIIKLGVGQFRHLRPGSNIAPAHIPSGSGMLSKGQ
jgi:hypothetical protein